ncbi:MAG: hypothetical protein CMF38_06150 [Legionellaceae bacterium]|nr:hypothetical protein [Legionellaceae bacterium]
MRHPKLFKPLSWMSSIHFIHHLVLYNQVLMAVIADKKAGKSTFASLLQQTLSMHVDSTLIHAQALSKLTDLEAQLKAQKILAADETLDDFVARVNASKQPKLIIIDDAHYLNVATLTTLMRFLQHNPLKNFLHICLVGNPSLTHALKALNTLGYQDAIHSFKLGGLNERETKTYIVHHTARKSRHLNHEKIQQTLFLKSAGNLARINELLEQQDLLLKPKICSQPFMALASIGGLMLCAAGYIFWSTHRLDFDSFAKNESPLYAHTVHLEQLKSELPTLVWPMSHKPFIDVAILSPYLRIVAQHDDNLVLPADMLNIDDLIKKQTQLQTQNQIVDEEDLKPSTEALKNTPKKVELLAVDDTKALPYTIQLMASLHRHDLEQLRQRLDLKTHTKIQPKQVGKQVWYVLTWGAYAKKQTAAQALAALPKPLMHLKPWICTQPLKIIS